MRLTLITALMTLVGTVAVVSPAAAAGPPPDSRLARAIDSNVRSQCKFFTTKVDQSTGTVTGHLTVNVSSRGYKAFRNITDVGYYCVVSDGGSNSTSISTMEPGRRIRHSEAVEIPTTSRYTVCVQGIYLLRGGAIGATELRCA
jgi:hypothetical protein